MATAKSTPAPAPKSTSLSLPSSGTLSGLKPANTQATNFKTTPTTVAKPATTLNIPKTGIASTAVLKPANTQASNPPSGITYNTATGAMNPYNTVTGKLNTGATAPSSSGSIGVKASAPSSGGGSSNTLPANFQNTTPTTATASSTENGTSGTPTSWNNQSNAGLYSQMIADAYNRSKEPSADYTAAAEEARRVKEEQTKLAQEYAQKRKNIEGTAGFLTQATGLEGQLQNQYNTGQAALSSQYEAATNRLGQANTQQGLQQGLLQNLISAGQPQLGQYGQTYYNPLNPGASGGNMNPQTQAPSFAQAIMNGQMTYEQAVASMGYAGNAGKTMLDNAILQAGGNPLQLQAQGSAQQSNITTGGTVGVNAGANAYTQNYPAVLALNQALNNIASAANMTVQNAQGASINPFQYAPANATLANVKTSLSNPGQVTFNSNINNLKLAISALYSANGGTIPSDITAKINAMSDGSLSMSGLQALISAAQQEGQARLQNAQATAQSAYQQSQGGSQTNSGGSNNGGFATQW